jgi:ABC-type antimicrobial peptide transport system permease subunit
MSAISRIFLSLAGFLAIAGAVYGITSHEAAGTTLFLAGAATFCFVGMVARRVGGRPPSPEAGEEAEIHVAPTIWPFGFAVAAVIIALGLVISAWLLIAGAIAFSLSAAGWLRDVGRSRTHADHS